MRAVKHFGIMTGAVLLVAVFFGSEAFAQRGRIQNVELKWAEGIAVDGDLSDWGGELPNAYSGQDFCYEIRNDASHLYLVVQLEEFNRQIQVLNQGLSFTINKNGRRRPSSAMIFPLADRIALGAIMSKDEDDRPDDIREAALQAIRGIYIEDIPGLNTGMISLDNDFGISAAAGLDSLGRLIVEMKMPLERLQMGDLPDQIAFNIKINGVIIPGSGGRSAYDRGMYGRYGYPVYRNNTPVSGPREESGVWVISKLATRDRSARIN